MEEVVVTEENPLKLRALGRRLACCSSLIRSLRCWVQVMAYPA